ncbi:MAG: RNA methyltransferase, partial [Oscillospiraceae bacterium]|nr:RNA methyltransferase [Oscillospiraceae bacterium]
MTVETIASRHNALLTRLRKLAASRAYREECGEYLGDGVKLLQEAVKWRAPLQTVLLSEGVEPPELPDGVRVARVSAELMRSVSPSETPQGALFTARLERPAPPDKLDGTRYLVLDGVQDPGNVGTILRTADAFDCDGVFLVNACADLYNPKTVRATMGAIFRQTVWRCAPDALAALLRASGIPL